MAGLFDNLYSTDPTQQSQLALAAGLLAGRGNLNGILGQALMGGQGAYNEAGTLKLKGQLGQAQMEDTLAQAQQRQQMVDMERRKLELLNNFFNGQPDASGAQQAIGTVNNAVGPGANTGPSPMAAQVMQAQQQPQQPQSPFFKPGAFNQIAGMKAAGLPDLTEQYKLATGGIPQAEGWNFNPVTGQRIYNPKIATSQSGQTSVTSMGPDGQLVVSAPQGAMPTYAGYQGIDAAIKAATGITSRKNAAGQTEDFSNLQVLQKAGALDALQRLIGGDTSALSGATPSAGPNPLVSPPSPNVGLKVPPAVQAQRDADRLKVLNDEYARAPTPELAREIKNAGGFVSGPTARQEAYAKDAGAQDAKFLGEVTTGADQARTSLGNIGLMRDVIDQNGFSPGAGAETFNNKVAPWLARLPGKPFGDQVSSYQEFAKNATQLSTTAARTMGAREPGSVIAMFRQAYPNADLQKSALQVMLTQQEAMQHYAIAKEQFINQWQNDHGSLEGANPAWNKDASQEAVFYTTLAKNYPKVWSSYYASLPDGARKQVAARLQAAERVGLTVE